MVPRERLCRIGLGGDFVDARKIAKSATRVGASLGNDIGSAAVGPCLIGGLCHDQPSPRIGLRRDEAQLRPEHRVEEKVAVARTGVRATQEKERVHPQTPRGGRGGPAMVAGDGAAGHDEVTLLFLRVGQEELQFADLVAGENRAGLVVMLDEQRRPAKASTEVRQRADARRVLAEKDAGFRGGAHLPRRP